MRQLSAILTTAGVDFSGMMFPSHSTISKTRIVSRHQQLLRLDVESDVPHFQAENQELLERSIALARTADAIILSDYAKGALSAPLCKAVIALARRAWNPCTGRPQRPGLWQICRRYHDLP